MRRLAFASAMLVSLAYASGAFGHASLLQAQPADGAVLPSAPAALTLTFNEPVAPLVTRLIGPGGEAVALAPAAAENATVTIVPAESLRRGTHVLSWRVISADGHPVGGAVVFSIGAPSGASGAGAEEADAAVRILLWAVKLALYVGLFVGVGGAFFRNWIAQNWIADANSPAARPVLVALLAGLLAAPVSIVLQGLDALALPLSAASQTSVWAAGVGTSYGRTAIAAALALLAGLLSAAARSRASSRAIARGLSLVGLAGIGLALSLSGHASTAAPQLVSRPAVALHGICVAFWIGSLLPLYASVRQSSAPHEALTRFSRVIPIPLALLVASGAWLAVVQLGRVDALWTTSYGKVLACKLVVVAGLLGLAALNRYRLVPKLAGQNAVAARPLARALEFVLALAVLGLVALWRFTPPPRALATEAPISVHVHGERAMAQIEITRAGAAGARADVQVLDGAFQPLAVKEVTLVFANPAASIEALRWIATPAGGNQWRVEHLTVPLAGRWILRVELLIDDFDKVMVEDTVALPRLP
jgi:copper transport protein